MCRTTPRTVAEETRLHRQRRRNAQDFPVSHRETNPSAYTHYQLCIRAENDYGASSWVFVGDDLDDHQRRGHGHDGRGRQLGRRPPPSRFTYRRESSVIEDTNRRHDVERLVWSVRPKAGTPMDWCNVRGQGVQYVPTRTIPRGTTQDVCDDPTAAASGLARCRGNRHERNVNINDRHHPHPDDELRRRRRLRTLGLSGAPVKTYWTTRTGPRVLRRF